VVVQTIVFRGLLGWAFGPRNFMKNGVPTLSAKSGIVLLSVIFFARRGESWGRFLTWMRRDSVPTSCQADGGLTVPHILYSWKEEDPNALY
jgi:hypothetical protein